MRRLFVLAALLFALPAHAVTIDWVKVGDPGNGCDPQPQGCFGSVRYVYWISKYEVTNSQYTDFLNAVAATDPNGFYSTRMSSSTGGITRSGVPGSYTYSTIPGRESWPVMYVSFSDALHFANWVEDELIAGGGSPETTISLPSEDQWYKAAHYDPIVMSYYDYPAGTDTQIVCAYPTATPNTALCNKPGGNPTDVGSYPGSASPYGTFDQGGNAWEWNTAIIDGFERGVRGGSYQDVPTWLAASGRNRIPPTMEDVVGIRLMMIPEPTTALLLAAGLAGLAAGRRRRS